MEFTLALILNNMANVYNKENPYYATDFPAYTENLKWQNEQNFANQQAWDARLYGTWEREQVQAWNERMWQENNAYNSIGAQIERARDAGVNPAALLGGDYKSAQANAPTTSPQGPIQAQTPSNNSTQRVMDSAATLVDSAKGFADNYLNAKQVSLNSREVDSQVRLNLSSMQKLAADAGVSNATEEQIRKSVTWIDDLNFATIMEKVSNVERVQNDLLVQLKELMIKEGIAESEIEVNDATADLTRQNADTAKALEEKYKAEAAGINLENKYIASIRGNEIVMQQYQLLDLHRRQQVADIIGLPMGTSEYEFNLALAKQGYLKTYISKCIIPTERAKWKPKDFDVERGTKFTIFSKDFGWLNRGRKSHNGNLADFLGVGGLYDKIQSWNPLF